MHSGHLIIIAAPSGAGKTSLIKALLKKDPQLCLSVSHTTREPRTGEQDGREYYFVKEEQFKQMLAKDAFIEHAQVFDHHYGTTKKELETKLGQNLDVMLEIDWQGARQVRDLYQNCTGIFILPPARQALENRLKLRKQDSNQVIARRLADALTDMSHYDEFEYVIVNDNFKQALAELQIVIKAQRLTTHIQGRVQRALLKKLLAK